MYFTFEIILRYFAVLLSSFVIFFRFCFYKVIAGFFFRKTSIILCFRNIFCVFCVFAMLSPEQNAQMNYCHY